ncbi:MAG: hypothetical protein RB191_01570, partial [Terriglobia bacterium]|nr:hypothetical protein [Terriglobia bacterium]
IARQETAAQAQRQAAQQAEIDRQQEALRKDNEPKPEPVVVPNDNWPITDAQILVLVMDHCGVGKIKADRRIRDYAKEKK